MENMTDLFVIGGGINGTAIAADAAGRGLSVVLCEKSDLAAGTSSASTKLIHGGLRYLELYEFNLVRKALAERDILMRRAPNLITPLEFILPHEKHLRSAALIRFGLFLYDHLSRKNSLPNSKLINLKNNSRDFDLLPEFEKVFSYYDCFTDDARLVILNALSAKEHGAKILTHTQFMSAQRENNLWKIKLQDIHSKKYLIFYSKVLINAAGPWVKEVQKNIADSQLNFDIELVKGSHIVIPKIVENNFAYILQNNDKRIIFAIPYQNNFTLIGTSDILFSNNLDQVNINDNEKNYFCDVINHYFRTKISTKNIIWSYAGVRCLQASDKKNVSKISRDYQLLLEKNTAPLLTVIGGKITTHRLLADEVMNKLKFYFPNMGHAWTQYKTLPGCDFENGSFDIFYQQLKSKYDYLPNDLIARYAKNYGTRAYLLLDNVKSINNLGIEFAAGLYQKEVEYLITHEWAKNVDDILWRRTKLGLFFSPYDIQKLNDWLMASY